MLSVSLSLPSPTAPLEVSLLTLPAYVHIFLSPPLAVNFATSPSLPSLAERSRVLTLGFVQICSLRGWKVVMRAKKNSLALSLTARLVSQMKPNENSIFSPCYCLPPVPACIPRSPALAPLICQLISYFCRCFFNTLRSASVGVTSFVAMKQSEKN